MKYFVFAILCCMEILLFIWIRKVQRSEGELKRHILRLLWLIVLVGVAQGVFVLCNSSVMAITASACYYIGMDWLLIVFMDYVEVYTQVFQGGRKLKLGVYGLTIIDSISILLNIAFGHMLEIERLILMDGCLAWRVSFSSLYYILHLLCSYLIVIYCVVSLAIKAMWTPPLYRRKYLAVFFLFLTVMILNGIDAYVGSIYDASVFFYCIMGLLLCYYSLFYKPKTLIDRTLALVAEEFGDAVFCFDPWGKCVFTNRRAEEYFGQGEVKTVIEKLLEAKLKENNEDTPETVLYRERYEIDGQTKFYNISYHKLFDKKKIYIGCFFTVRDRTEEVEKFQEEHYRLAHDKLTGVFNREYFFEAVEKVLAANPTSRYFMVCSDIKGFKLYNDLFGEKMGDEVLKAQAELIGRGAGTNAVYGRIAGDEFAILVPAERYHAGKFTESVEQMKRRFTNSQYQMHIYAGVYEIEDRTEPVSVMCDKAKLAIEANRENYNEIVTFYNANLLEKSLYERKIVGEFDRALREKEFCMFLQPQISSDGKLLGAEALVRWKHPERGMVYPGDFIGVFEKTGLIYRLDRYMWERAAEKLGEWKENGRENLYISINVSAKDFFCMDIFGELTGLVEKYGISPKNMKLEITETVMMTEMQSHLELLQRLRNYGFDVEIDDFGSGYSSLNMLKNIDVDIVKIDMGFLDETERLERGEYILNSIILLLKRLGMGVITEGVETKEQMESLMEMGCHMFQGYYFDRPMPVVEFEKKYN